MTSWSFLVPPYTHNCHIAACSLCNVANGAGVACHGNSYLSERPPQLVTCSLGLLQLPSRTKGHPCSCFFHSATKGYFFSDPTKAEHVDLLYCHCPELYRLPPIKMFSLNEGPVVVPSGVKNKVPPRSSPSTG